MAPPRPPRSRHVGPVSDPTRPNQAHHPASIARPEHPGPVSDPSGPKRAHDRSERAIEAIADGQHGVVTLGQLEALGLGPRGTRHRVAGGRLRRVHRGVYALGRPSAVGRWAAALMACGPDALLSHRSAAALWGLSRERGAAVDVIVPTRAGRRRPGISVHRGAGLAQTDVTARDGLRCTTPSRTLLDLAATVPGASLARAVTRAEELGVFDLGDLADLLARNGRRPGTGALRRALDGYSAPAVTRSEVERRMLAIVRRAGLPDPSVNAWIPLADGGGYEADFLWREARLVVEVDGRAHHATRMAFEHDRRRDRRLALAGLETRRYAAIEVLREPERVARELQAFLDARGDEVAGR